MRTDKHWDWRTFFSMRVWVSGGMIGAIVAIIPGLIWAPLFPVVFSIVAAAVIIGMSRDPSVVAVCPHCRKRVKIGATTCHHCGREVEAPAAA